MRISKFLFLIIFAQVGFNSEILPKSYYAIAKPPGSDVPYWDVINQAPASFSGQAPESGSWFNEWDREPENSIWKITYKNVEALGLNADSIKNAFFQLKRLERQANTNLMSLNSNPSSSPLSLPSTDELMSNIEKARPFLQDWMTGAQQTVKTFSETAGTASQIVQPILQLVTSLIRK